MKFETEYIEKLAKILSDNKLTELMIEDGGQAILLKKEKEVVTTQVVSAQANHQIPSHVPVIEVKEDAPKKGTPLTSPMVGTFYKASSPDSEPFAKLGQTVTKGQTVCIIEAMKLMNEIEAEASGKVIEICVEDGQPVEFGQILMYVE